MCVRVCVCAYVCLCSCVCIKEYAYVDAIWGVPAHDNNHIWVSMQVGRVVAGPAEFYSARIPRRQQKRSLVEELFADEELRRLVLVRGEGLAPGLEGGAGFRVRGEGPAPGSEGRGWLQGQRGGAGKNDLMKEWG